MHFNVEKWQICFMTLFNICLLLATGQHALAGCETSLKLEGVMSVECCTPRDKCIPAGKAVDEYSEAAKDDPSLLSISVQSSPWHFYDNDMRILTVEELAEMVKPTIKKVQRIALIASWTGVAPDRNGKSLAQKLSDALNGFPVTGMDGFVWIAKDGSVRTTHQAFTIKQKCPYGVHPGKEVMVSLVAGWPVGFEEDYVKERNSEGIMNAGAGWDIFMLCPERALQSFEAAAKLSNPIAAYNAALMRLERGKGDDVKEATSLLTQADKLGDKKARTMLRKINREGM
jgi:hypothetical protein